MLKGQSKNFTFISSKNSSVNKTIFKSAVKNLNAFQF